MRDMISRYGSDVVVAEVGMPWQQAAATRAMLTKPAHPQQRHRLARAWHLLL